MKKIFRTVLATAIAALAFTACEDVPAPYDIPSSDGTGGGTTVQTIGTADEPITVAEALAQIDQLTDGATSSQAAYVKGKVVRVVTSASDFTKYGNINYYISDDGADNNTVYVYAGDGLNGDMFSAVTDIKAGDEVVVYGNLQRYVNSSGRMTPEIAKGNYIVKLTKGSGGTGDETIGTATEPITVAKALELINGYADSGESATDAYVKGIVVSVGYYNANYKSLTYYISDDGTTANQLQVYSGKALNGADFASAADLKVGATVVVKGKLKKYMSNGTANPEINQGSEIVSMSGGSDTPVTPVTPTPSGDNLLTNGGFETWADALPTGWKSASTASNATLSQSTEAHGGSSAVKVGGDASANKRLASQELTLKAGTYTFTFYAKSTTSDPSQVRPGYVPVTDGKVGSYAYGDYANINNTEWTLVSHTFTLATTTTVCLVVMNPKTSNYATAQDVLIDDATLTTADGGLADGGSTGGGESTEAKAVSVAEFLAAAESTSVWYQLTGTISNIKSTTYGNFDLTDETGTVYVYGVLREKGSTNKKEFEALMSEKGIKEGSKITIIGNRGSYNGTIEVTNAYFVSVSN